MSLASWMTQTIYVASATSVSSYGKVAYGPARLVKARVEVRRRMVRKGTGDEAVSNHRILTISPILLTDRIWLPGVSPTTATGSNLPLAVEALGDKVGSKTLYQVDL